MNEAGSKIPLERILSFPDTVPLTIQEVAAVTRLSPSTLRKWSSWRRPGDLVPFAKRGGKLLFRPSDVRRWLGLEPAA